MFIHSLQILLLAQILIETLLLAEIIIELLLNLALIQWYDFKSQTRLYIYGCPHIKLKELYNFVVIEAIQNVVHVVPVLVKQMNIL